MVFVDPVTFTPAAFYVDAEQATLSQRERESHLDTGHSVKQGVLYGPDGQRVDEERPQQLFRP